MRDATGDATLQNEKFGQFNQTHTLRRNEIIIKDSYMRGGHPEMANSMTTSI
jgi:hypothetical protein